MHFDVNTPNAELIALREKNQRPIVYCDGKPVRFWQIADTEEGYVKYCPEGRDGRPVFDTITEDYVMRMTLGIITVEFVDVDDPRHNPFT